MSDPKTEPPDATDLARQRALLCHRPTSLYLLRDELLRFGDQGQSVILRFPLDDIERVGQVVPRRRPMLCALALGLLPIASLHLEPIASSALYVWLLLPFSFICLCYASAHRHLAELELKLTSGPLRIPVDGEPRLARAFATSLSLIFRDRKSENYDDRVLLRSPAQELSFEPKPSPKPDANFALRDATARIRVLGEELVILDEQEHFAARVPLRDVRELRCTRGYTGGLLFLLIAALLSYAGWLTSAHVVASVIWYVCAFCFGFAVLVAWPWWKPVVVMEMRDGRVEHELARSWSEVEGFVQSLRARLQPRRD
jgi:hypothetical protein